MALPLHVLTSEAMALDAADRLRLASELIDSVEGPDEPGWTDAWTTELQARSAAADAREAAGLPRGSEWAAARERLLIELIRR